MAPIVRAPGAPSDAQVALTRASAEEGAVTTSQRYIWSIPRNNPASTNDFPVVPTRHDQYDTVANIKSQFAVADTVGSNWVVPFTGEDAAYELRKRDDQENALFEQWVMQKYDITDPAQNRILQGIAPDLFKRREEVIDSQQRLSSQYAKLRLRGARTLDDLRIQWLIETGRLSLPKGPIWDPKKWREEQLGTDDANEDAARNDYRYKFGMFSPLRWVTTTGNVRSATNPADIMGDTANRVTGNITAPEPTWGNVWGGNPVMYPYTPGNLGAGPVADGAQYHVGGDANDGGVLGAMENPLVGTANQRAQARAYNSRHVDYATRPRPWM